MPSSDLHERLLMWYSRHARDLPWRAPEASPWAVLVSEVMLQQTPVNRVLPVYGLWIDAWPRPADLAKAEPGDAVRAWGRLGYPRRALRLHQAAAAIVERHKGDVPPSYDELLALPGIGSYTAAAVASFAFRQRHAVLDTNVRRVLARVTAGSEQPPPALTVAERKRAEALLPDDPETAAAWAVAVMELGALVCTSQKPACLQCPLASRCAWNTAGRPAYAGPRRAPQRYVGTDRQVRGLVLALLRDASTSASAEEVTSVWPDHSQLKRAVEGLREDGLLEIAGDRYQLPRGRRPAL